jgi:hypothetical protein
MVPTIMIAAAMAASSGPQCQETTHHSDGRVSVRTVPDEGQGASSASSSSSSRGGSAHSSVSASSSSSSDGNTRSSVSTAGDQGRTVQVERDERGCRITITEKGDSK